MDRLLKCFSDRDRLWILHRLAAGPATQATLRSELAQRKDVPRINPGTMHRLLEPLLESGLITRESERGQCRLTYRREIARVVNALADLGDQVAQDLHGRAVAEGSASAELRIPP
jgi:DNA-binding HxlR family transcriptional regulator